MLKSQNLPHGRVVITIEACEESGSKDLPYYMEKLQDVIGTPSLIICLDSGCGNYDQMWLTCSLRGLLVTRLKVSVLAQGCHSGTGSGIVPSSFRILRELLDRIEDSKTGKVLLDEAYVKVPEIHAQYAKETAESLGSNLTSAFTMPKGMRTTSDDLGECVLNRCWKPQISYTGIDGVPAIKDAGNVLRTHTTVNLSIRLPPTLDPAPLMKKLEEVLTTDTPYGAKVELECPKAGVGWMAPPMKKWLSDAVNEVSQQYWGKPVRCWGEGGSIPFMGMMGRAFPDCLFVITGLLGPGSNAHGPNEYMHIPNFKRLSAGMATLLLSQYKEARNPTSPPQSPGTTKPCYAPAPFSDRCCE